MKLLTHIRSNAIAYAALFFALTAGAYAAGLKKDSVGSKQIKANAVKQAEIAPGAVSGAKLADAAVTGSKLADEAVTGAKLADGSVAGADVDEASLGTVPKADDAGSVGGLSVKSFSKIEQTPSPAAQVVSVGGLTLSLACDASNGVLVTATTSVDNASLQSIAFDQAGGAEAVANDDDFDAGAPVAVVPLAANAGNLTGSLRYRTADERVVTVEFATDAPTGDCELWGPAIGA